MHIYILQVYRFTYASFNYETKVLQHSLVLCRFTKAYEECMNSEDEAYLTGGHLRCSSNGNYDEAQCIQQTYDNSYHPSYDQDMCFCYQTGDKVTLSLLEFVSFMNILFYSLQDFFKVKLNTIRT